MSILDIAKAVGRSKSAMQFFLKDPEGYRTKKSTGRSLTLKVHDRTRLTRLASSGEYTTNQIHQELGVDASIRTSQRKLQRCDYLKYEKASKSPCMTDHQKTLRVQWVKRQIRCGQTGAEWCSQMRKSSISTALMAASIIVMTSGPTKGYVESLFWWWVRDCVGWDVVARENSLAFLKGNQDALDYQQTLASHLFELIDGVHDGNYVIQRDNASIYHANATKLFLADLNIKTTDWPALSPDLNPIESHGGLRRGACTRRPTSTPPLMN